MHHHHRRLHVKPALELLVEEPVAGRFRWRIVRRRIGREPVLFACADHAMATRAQALDAGMAALLTQQDARATAREDVRRVPAHRGHRADAGPSTMM
jgi:hypothetical protein